MISKLSHAVVYVTDQDRAKAFYTDKLGLQLREDVRTGGPRWLTVGPISQPETSIALMAIAASPAMDDQSAKALRVLVEAGVLHGLVLETEDLARTVDELRRRGVEFLSDPVAGPDGIEAVIRDDSGNTLTLIQNR